MPGHVRKRSAIGTAAGVLALLGWACAATASEPMFGYVYTTDTLPKGKFEVEQWVTDREGQAHGNYHGVEMRTELEYGLTDSLQVALYQNYSYVGAHNNSVDHLTEGLDISPDHDPHRALSDFHNDGVSAELLWRVMSPYTRPIGLAFYIEPQLGPRENGLELRAIVQKNLLDDRLILAGNAWVEFDKEQGTNLGAIASSGPPSFEKTKATYLEFDAGASYRFRPHWSVGVEFRNHNEYANWSLAGSDQQHTAFFLGPNIHYGGERWFFTLSALRQLGAVGYTDDQKAQIYHGLLYGNEHTTWDGLRLKVGRSF